MQSLISCVVFLLCNTRSTKYKNSTRDSWLKSEHSMHYGLVEVGGHFGRSIWQSVPVTVLFMVLMKSLDIATHDPSPLRHCRALLRLISCDQMIRNKIIITAWARVMLLGRSVSARAFCWKYCLLFYQPGRRVGDHKNDFICEWLFTRHSERKSLMYWTTLIAPNML